LLTYVLERFLFRLSSSAPVIGQTLDVTATRGVRANLMALYCVIGTTVHQIKHLFYDLDAKASNATNRRCW
jgi:hypothetical protein